MIKRESRQLGKKIALIRKFRRKTQGELGIEVGFNPANAAIRISQYESGKKAPRRDMLIKLAEALNISVFQIMNSEVEFIDFVMILFWYEEIGFRHPEVFPFFSPSASDEETDDSDDADVFYGKDFRKGRRALVITLGEEPHHAFLEEWMRKKKQWLDGEITRNEYFEWKLHWPSNDYVEYAIEMEYEEEDEYEDANSFNGDGSTSSPDE